MAKPAFIVEGFAEKKIVQTVCEGAIVQRIGTNGRDVSMSTMAKFLSAQIRTLGNRCFPIIVIFDRETRELSCEKLAESLLKELEVHGVDASQIRIFVSDRCLESWIAPFILNDCKISPVEAIPANVKGKYPKGAVKEKFRRKGLPYVETVDGVRLFFEVGPARLDREVPNFRRLATGLRDVCAWIRRAIPVAG